MQNIQNNTNVSKGIGSTERAFYEIDEFPRLKALARNWQVLRQEFLNLNAPLMEINRAGKTHAEVYAEVVKYVQAGGRYGWLAGWDPDNRANPNWIQYGLMAFDKIVPFVQHAMPKTMQLLAGMEGIKVCALSLMKPQTYLGLHNHPEIHEEGLLQMHITIDVPAEQNYSYLNVNGAFNHNVLGDAIIFDGSLDHFALNASPDSRTIFYMEFERSKYSTA